MKFIVHAGDDMPIYRQIANQVVDALSDGRLKDGDRLASHRELAEQLVVAPLTVKKAYDTLESEGLVRSVRGHGTFVTSSRASESAPGLRREQLRAPARRLLAKATIAGFSLDQLTELLREEEASLSRETKRRLPHRKTKKRKRA